MSNTIWAVTSGEYSDYCVEAVFSTEEAARDAKAAGMGDDVTEFDYYQDGVKPSRRQWVHLGVTVHVTTAEIVKWHWGSEPDFDGQRYEQMVWHHPSRPTIEKRAHKVTNVTYGHVWRIEVDGVDDKRTRKSFYDFVAKTRAEIIEGVR